MTKGQRSHVLFASLLVPRCQDFCSGCTQRRNFSFRSAVLKGWPKKELSLLLGIFWALFRLENGIFQCIFYARCVSKR